MDEEWKFITDLYNDKFGIDSDLVDFVADSYILLLFVSGNTNNNIAKLLQLPVGVVDKVVKSFGFDKHKKDLEFNPYFIYRYLMNIEDNVTLEDFEKEISTQYGKVDNVETLFKMCRKFSDLEERLDREWL